VYFLKLNHVRSIDTVSQRNICHESFAIDDKRCLFVRVQIRMWYNTIQIWMLL